MRIAVVGSGVSGLVCAHLLQGSHDVVLYEADERPGGHAHTHRLELADGEVEVDSGFIVYNETTYPLFVRLLERLRVASQPSDMSFSVTDPSERLEWRGTSLSTVFAQRGNLARPAFIRMLVDIRRFNRLMEKVLEEFTPEDLTLAEVLESRSWTPGFRDWYLIPLGSSIWSADPSTFMQIPAVTFARFFQRHGLLALRDQTRWRTVTGGSQSYVKKILAPLEVAGCVRLGTQVEKIRRSETSVELVGPGGVESFDHVVVATHSDQALKLLSDPDRLEEHVLGSIRYQRNGATLHCDSRMMPENRRAWASWNYRHLGPEARRATLTYYLNQLQGIRSQTPVLVTLNQDDEIDPDLVFARMQYDHPVLDVRAVAAQRMHSEINGRNRTWFCGAYWGYGFHEDGVRSAVEVCQAFGARL